MNDRHGWGILFWCHPFFRLLPCLAALRWQRQTIDALRRINQCGEGHPWEDQPGCTLYPSEVGSPVVTYIHTGGHRYPAAAPALIVRFFRQHPSS